MNLEMRLKIQDYIRTKIPIGKEFSARSVAEALAGIYAYGPTSNEVAIAIKMMSDVEYIPSTKGRTSSPTLYRRLEA